MTEISRQSKMLCGILLIRIPTIQYGDTYLLQMLTTHDRTSVDYPLRHRKKSPNVFSMT